MVEQNTQTDKAPAVSVGTPVLGLEDAPFLRGFLGAEASSDHPLPPPAQKFAQFLHSRRGGDVI